MSEIQRYIADHQCAIEALGRQAPVIERMAEAMIACLRRGGCVFWLGNGGSAADCQHLAAELVGRFERERDGFASIALTTDSSVLTFVGNDYGFERIFARQVEALCRTADLVVAISTSGNSPNVLRAAETAVSRGIETLGTSGRTGGALAELLDVCPVVPDDNTARIQESHILVGHILCDLVERHFTDVAEARNAE